jgi:hypothetical protein
MESSLDLMWRGRKRENPPPLPSRCSPSLVWVPFYKDVLVIWKERKKNGLLGKTVYACNVKVRFPWISE